MRRNRAKQQKISVKSEDRDGGDLGEHQSRKAIVADYTTTVAIKKEIPEEVSEAATVHCTTSKKNREHQHSVIKSKRSSAVDDSASEQRQVDSSVVMTSRKRKAVAVSLENDEDKSVCQSDNKKRPPRKTQHSTQMTKSCSEIVKKEADKKQLETAVSPLQPSCRKFLGAHTSIAGMLATW